MVAMAKAKPKKGPAAGPEMMTKGVRMTREYSDWIDRLASSERMSVSAVVDRALAGYAKQVGFEAPPERVP